MLRMIETAFGDMRSFNQVVGKLVAQLDDMRRTTYRCGPSPFLSALQDTFPLAQAVHDITDGMPGTMVEGYPGLAKYIWNNVSAPLLAKFLSNWLNDNGYDGLYMDGRVPHHYTRSVQCTPTPTLSNVLA